jgi:hypothetical protein
VISAYPEFKHFFSFVDFEGHSLGRLNQEMKKERKLREASVLQE